MTELTGITWNHTRGFTPMAATAQRFSELNAGVDIRWEKRSLQDFADSRVEKLAERFDLLVLDHPSVGVAAGRDVLLPLDEHTPASFLVNQAHNSVGLSHASYSYGGHQWALAIDAATPVSGFRRDLLERAGATPPKTWRALLELARRGLVVFAGIPVDLLMHFNMLCVGLGEEPYQCAAKVASEETGRAALGMLRELSDLCDPACLNRNPIQTWDLLSNGYSAAFCPFAYGYSNYARRGYGAWLVEFGGLLALEDGSRLRSTLGGAGLAVSSRCRRVAEAIRYCEFVASPECQRTLYFDSGGQPGHRAAWMDDEVNRRSGGFFRNTLETLDGAWLRPRYEGYLTFQDKAGRLIHGHLCRHSSAEETLGEMNQIYAESRGQHQ